MFGSDTVLAQVGNTESYTSSDWLDDMRLAKNAHIDAFALNMAHGDPVNEQALPAAFSAAASTGLSLFFSFDYAGNGSWPPDTVIQYINKYAGSGSYFHHQGRPFVSTFEGPDNATDWIDIKRRTLCFFMPDWSSLGAKKAIEAAGGIADGLFSWAAWPWGDWEMFTYSDASYRQYLGGKPYMMPVSPWFYTNLPGYDKNWLWKGDRMWGSRWLQTQWLQPEFIQIISWNDYGESHYIGPVRDKAMKAFDIGRAPFNYGTLPHDSWRDILPFVIDMYKNNVSTIDVERAVAWYKLVPARSSRMSGCDTNGTVGNTASQLQFEFEPDHIMEDKIFYAAILDGPPNKVECLVGGTTFWGLTIDSPEGGGAGLYTGECGDASMAGPVKVKITRGSLVLEMAGEPITTDCQRWNGFINYNAYTMGTKASSSTPLTAADISNLVCVSGTGMWKVESLCQFTCANGYCPEGACVCTKLGKQPKLPKAKDINGYPTAKYDESFSGLCSFACNYGVCADFAPACSTTKVPLPVWPESLFDPYYCIEGSTTNDYFAELCQFTCAHGFCPLAVCTCDVLGFFNELVPTITSNASTPSQMPDHGLCKFACQRGFCPADKCFEDGDWDADGFYGPDYDPIEDEYLDTSVVESWICDPAVAPTTLDDLIAGMEKGDTPSACWNQWALTILFNTLLSFNSQFVEAAKGYDPLYDAYERWVKDSVNPQLRTFVDPSSGRGAKYFDCAVTGSVGKVPKQNCQSVGQGIKTDGNYVDSDWTVEFVLTDENGFYDSVAEEMGIEREWITFGDVTLGYVCAPKDPPSTGTRLVGPPNRITPCTKLYQKWKNAPVSVDRDKVS